MRLQHIEYLIGLAALPVLLLFLFLLLRWKRKTAAQMGDPVLVKQLIGNFSPLRFVIKASLAILAFTILILAATNLQKPGAMQNVQRKGVDVMFVLDVSKSMLAHDIKPSRLEKAKQLMLRLSDKLDNDRLGLVLFAGRAYMQMPLTSDHGAARMYIQDAGPDVVPTQGTVIAEALRMANSAFNNKERKYKSILLISDGEDHDPDALKVAKELARDGVMINTIGLGSPEGSPIEDPATGEVKKDAQGNTVISKLNEAELQQLAAATNGQYLRLENVDDALITMSQQLDSAEKKSMSDAEFIDYISLFQWFLGLALVLLVVEYFLSERHREKKAPITKAVPARALLLLLLTLGVLSTTNAQTSDSATQTPATAEQTPSPPAQLPSTDKTPGSNTQTSGSNALIRSGNRYYKKKQLDQSLKQYQSAVQKAPDNPTANYNLGNAQFRKNSYEEAAKSYDATIANAKDKDMQEKGYYNKGVAMAKQKKLQESIDAWKSALRLNSADSDARENLERALTQLKQQQQQQQKDQKQQQKDKKDKKDEKKNQDQQQQQQQPQEQKQQPSRLNKQQVEQLLKALQQKENDLQNKMNQSKVKTPTQPEKDW